jgi:hypothetical protein
MCNFPSRVDHNLFKMHIIKLLPTAVILALFVLLVIAIQKRLGDKSKELAKLAKDLGLPLMNDRRGIFGNHLELAFILDVWRGREVNIHHIVRVAGNAQTYSVAIDMPVKVSPELRMTFTSKNVLTQAALQPGLEQVATGNVDFDNYFYVKSTDANVAKAVMNQVLCAQFIKTWAEFGIGETLSVREGRIHYEEQGWMKSAETRRRFAAMVAVCHDLAESLDKVAPAAAPAPEAK